MGLLNARTALVFFPLLKFSVDRSQRFTWRDVALREG